MNLVEFRKEISQRTGFSDEETKNFLDAFENTVTEALQNDDYVMIPGFCTFNTYTIKAHYAKNEHIYSDYFYLPDRKVVRIKPGKRLKRAVRGTDAEE